MFCAKCESIVPSITWDSLSNVALYRPHHENISELSAASKKCSICFAIFRGLHIYNPAASELPYSFQYAAYSPQDNSTSKILQLKGNFGDPYACYSHEFLLHPLGEKRPTGNDLAQPQTRPRSVAELVDLRGVETTALSWLRDCLQNHSMCRSSSTHAQPRRLLKLEPDRIRLVETSTLPRTPQYASFSHCWGRTPTFEVLTNENLASMAFEVPRGMLAKSFKDAVTVCQHLKIEHLWIDSLCIIQRGDEGDDWSYHVTAMGGIYAGAVLNICADRAASSLDGFLQPREDLRFPATITIPGGASNETFQLIDLEAANLDIATSRTSRRAWILQERLLSPRVLHFTGSELYWECSEQRLACESFPNGIPELSLQFQSRLAPFNPSDCYTISTTDGAQDQRTMTLSVWYRTLGDYTSRQISFPDKDKFAALAGVAQEFQRILRDRYVAGMFVSDLPLALLWELPESAPRRTSSNRAPSWSWASQDGCVQFSLILSLLQLGDTLKQHVDIKSATSTPVNDKSPLGQISKAELVLLGYTAAVRWVYDESEQYMDVESCDVELPSFKDIPPVLGQLDDPAKYSISPAGATALLVSAFADNDAHWGLLLVPDAEAKYRRAGVWWTCPRQLEMGCVMQTREKVLITLI